MRTGAADTMGTVGRTDSHRGRLRVACALSVAAMLIAGCAARPQEIGREPELSPVGSGLQRAEIHQRTGSLTSAKDTMLHTSDTNGETTGSLWDDRGADLFRDARARRTGDILTVKISIKDKASLDNSSKRSRDASAGLGVNLSHAIALPILTTAGTANAQTAVNSNTSTDGKGEIERSESINLRIAAVVTGILPNGKLIIQGSQEVRVNFEVRVLTFSGIVNITDIAADNTISYERIAEARMSYGGRGRITEVQQPGWMQQIADQLSPY